MGYSLYKVVHQADSIGNRLKEVQDSVQDLAKFGKMVDLVSFLPFEYVVHMDFHGIVLIYAGLASKRSKSCTMSPKVSHRTSCDHSSR